MSSLKKAEIRTLTAGGRTVSYQLERKAVKRINLRVMPNGDVRVSAPTRIPLRPIEDFIKSKLDWIDGARARVQARRGEQLMLSHGEILPIEGISHTICTVRSDRQGAFRENGRLVLQLHDPQDAAERRLVFERFWRAEATRILSARMRALYPLFAPLPPTLPHLTVRTMKTRWGSCTAAKNHITLNASLLFVPPPLADYVILHEFCHFKHQNHSDTFYRYLQGFCPDYAAARRALRAFPVPQL